MDELRAIILFASIIIWFFGNIALSLVGVLIFVLLSVSENGKRENPDDLLAGV